MNLERLDYFWGRYSSVEAVDPEHARQQVHLDRDNLSAPVKDSFREEAISELSGEYGVRGVGSPAQVEVLHYTLDGTEREIVVVNRMIVMFKTDDPTMTRLHRFIETMKAEADSSDGTQADG